MTAPLLDREGPAPGSPPEGNHNLRVIKLDNHQVNRQFLGNIVKTAKYSILTFLPKNLIVQFSKLANVYFFFICLMQVTFFSLLFRWYL